MFVYVYTSSESIPLQERKAILEINKERKLSSLQSAQIPGQRMIVSVQIVHFYIIHSIGDGTRLTTDVIPFLGPTLDCQQQMKWQEGHQVYIK